MNKHKPGFREKFRYRFDNLMSKGTIVLVVMLFLITAVVVVIAGVLGALVNKQFSAGSSIWQSFMHTLDAGTLSGNDTGNIGFVLLMTVVTICGIFVTSILIGIINSGFEQKLYSLRKGNSKVIETGHTVIIGFTDSIYTILSELIEAGANKKKNCVIVLGEEEKDTMEEMIRGHIKDFKTTRVICKTGNPIQSFMLERASVETCRSVIINQDDDFSVIKSILAVVSYLKAQNAFDREMHITSMIHSEENLQAARIAGEGKAEVLFFKDAISRIIAHTCRQPGLSQVLTEFFDFGGAEFYFERFPELSGRMFGEVLNLFERSTVVGLEQGGRVLLNPPMDTRLSEDDCVIHLAEDDGVSKPQAQPSAHDLSAAVSGVKMAETDEHLLILGCNEYLPDILAEYDHYAAKDTVVTVADTSISGGLTAGRFENIRLVRTECDIYNRRNLETLLEKDVTSILLLSDLNCSFDDADARTILLLIHIRNIGKLRGRQYSITSEMRSVNNQKLAKVADVNDFIVGSTITNLIVTQISENRKLSLLFEDLLDADGSELYMKKAGRYVTPGAELDFFALTEIARQRGEIAVGYKKVTPEGMLVVTNPDKRARISFGPEDYLIVIARDDS